MRAYERFNDPEESIRQSMHLLKTTMWSSIPGYVVDFDPATCSASVQVGVKAIQRASDGSTQAINISVLKKVPVVFPHGGGCALTFPVKNGDECLVVFASRSMDAWWQSGGIQAQSDPTRAHSLSDGFAILGPMSKPNVITGISTTTTRLRSNDNSTFVELDPTGKLVNITAPNGINLNGVTIDSSGNMNSPATITASTDVVGGGKSLKTHTHGGVTSGGSNTAPPN
ncbi:Gp138 family membrane-puncturing spike protein [Solilutibacter silvestris]|uniref:Gp138 family membrane-puncturing spike protein n=1 Tax=Solilutibacter silvestris TaxID=1645665 RepID=UPI003D350C72